MSKVIAFTFALGCLLCVGIADAQQAFLQDDFSAGASSKLYDLDTVGRDAALIHGVLFQDSAELGLRKGLIQNHELWLQNGPIVSTKESFEGPVKVRVLWAHETAPDRNEYFAVTIRGSGLKVAGDGAYKQGVLQNGVSFVVHTNGQVQIVELKNGKAQQLSSTQVDTFPRGGRVNWFVLEVTDNGGAVRADISNAYIEPGKHICTIEAKPKGKLNPKANKVFFCNKQLDQNEQPGNNSWIRNLSIEPAKNSLAVLK